MRKIVGEFLALVAHVKLIIVDLDVLTSATLRVDMNYPPET